MKVFSSISRPAAMCMVAAAWFTACSSAPSTSSPTEDSVDTAYAALVADMANCGKQVKTCVEAAGSDQDALGVCRADFDSCRESAGKNASGKLASAVRACTSEQNSCVRSAAHGEAGSCQDALRVCLRAAHPKHDADADAGSDEGDGRGKPADCLDELHVCVKADGPANTCAENVRQCVRDAMPKADEVVPADDADDSDETDESADEPKEPKSHGKPAQAGSSAAPGNSAAAGNSGAAHGSKGKMSAARMCVDALSACVDSGSAPRTCAQTLKQCHADAKSKP